MEALESRDPHAASQSMQLDDQSRKLAGVVYLHDKPALPMRRRVILESDEEVDTNVDLEELNAEAEAEAEAKSSKLPEKARKRKVSPWVLLPLATCYATCCAVVSSLLQARFHESVSFCMCKVKHFCMLDTACVMLAALCVREHVSFGGGWPYQEAIMNAV